MSSCKMHLVGLILAAMLPAACTVPAPPAPSANAFAGSWGGPERHQIAFRDDTIVVNPPGEPPTALNAAACAGQFRFGYARKSRDALLSLAPHQPDVRRRLGEVLVRPDYPVAELSCGEGGTTYVMLDERNVVAIHRDRDIAGVERLSRL